MKIKIIFLTLSFLLLVYMLVPGPSSINDFPHLPDSLKSTLEGDTIQVPNVAGYFSNNYRDFATKFYRQAYKENTFFPFSPFRLNHPPEYAFTAIKDQTHSTYLEEYIYPLRGSLFVNGLEPFYEDRTPRYAGAIQFDHQGVFNDTKVTLRYYPSSIFTRILVWIGINASIIFLWKLGKKILYE